MKEIVIDTLGSDRGEVEIVEGAIDSRHCFPNYRFVLVGTEKHIHEVLKKEGENIDDYVILDSKPLDDDIHDAMSMLRFKGHCSIVDAFDYAKSHREAIGVFSAGPTGMILVSSIRHIGCFPQVNFPVLASFLYNIHHKLFCLVDCGANIEIREDKLLQFGQLGSALMKSYCGIDNPRVGLMNVGKEDTKGDSLRRAAFPLFQESGLNFIGNIEGSDVFMDKVDVVACDGFSGNVILKNTESVGLIGARMAEMNHEEKTARQLYEMFAYNELGGAILLGTDKIVMKAHGASNRKSVKAVVKDIIRLDENHFIELMRNEIASEKKQNFC